MKKLWILLLAVGTLNGCTSTESNNNTNISADNIKIEEGQDVPEPKFEWKEMSWDFGTIKDGDRVEHTFRFTNAGDADLIISNASASCGCTIPNWPKEPIGPGEKGEIKVEFNSTGKSGQVSKEVTIIANTVPVKTELHIKAFVVKQ